MSKTTIKTLRYYDEIGLLRPQETDRFSGYRFYSTAQLITIHRIQALRQVGLSLSEIKLIVSGHDAAVFLRKRKAELIVELNEGTDQLSRIEFILQGKEEKNYMNYLTTIKELPGGVVYSAKMTVSGYESYFDLIPAIGERVARQYPNLKCAVPEYCYITYLDGEHREKDIHIEFCEAVDKIQPDFDEIEFREIEPVTAATVLHKGPYSKLAQAYAFLFKWIEENGYVMADNPRESYIDGIWNKESEEDWLTELQVPIARA